MNGYDTHDEQQPMTWIRGQPIYAAHFVALVFVVSMLLTSLLMFAKAGAVLAALSFSSFDVLHGQLWRVLTYGLVNQPSLWFVIDMLMIIWFGRELEKFFGRKKFLGLYAGLYLLKPVLFTVIGLWTPSGFAGQTGGFALFVAFATLYPGAMLLFNLMAKWVAIVLVALYALIALSDRDTVGLIALLATTGFAYGFVRYQQGHFTLPSFPKRRRQPRLRVLPSESEHSPASGPNRPSPRVARDKNTAEMDALLDKIARSGMGSLTTEERARLDAAAKAHTQRKFGR